MLPSFPQTIIPQVIAVGKIAFFPYNNAVIWSYIIKQDGWYRICAVGGGGSGGCIFTTTIGGGASGGGGGGYVEQEVYLYSGTVLTISPGRGGQSQNSTVSGTGVNGQAGQDTTVKGGSGGLTAFGGARGVFVTVTSTSAIGGLGGSGIGGDYWQVGGSGGDAAFVTNNAAASGAGAAGSPLGDGGNGGSVSGNGAGGGGGCGPGNAGGGGIFSDCCGGGTGGPATGNTLAGNNRLGLNFRSSADGYIRNIIGSGPINPGFDCIVNPFYCLTGGGSLTQLIAPGIGGGTGGRISVSEIAFMGGGGGSINIVSGTSFSCRSVIGGGSGGSASTVGTAQATAGGDGLVVIERIG